MMVRSSGGPFPERLVLTGFMGTGKSKVGAVVAGRLGLPFLDLDRLIETLHGKSVAAIFAESGEAGFRAAERGAVRWASSLRRAVVSTGGGTFLDPANRRDLADRSLVVTLTADALVIASRVEASAASGHRPLLMSGDVGSRIADLMAARAPIYAGSDLTVDTSNLTIDEVAGRIADWARRSGLTVPGGPGAEGRWTPSPPLIVRAPSYDVVVGRSLEDLPDFIAGFGRRAVFTVADAHTAALFGASQGVGEGRRLAVDAVVPAGEAAKTFAEVESLHAAMAGVGLGRDGLVVALGGGVVGDLAGFAAATYMRGIPVVQVPTTLLAQVDSAIGGKTAVNVGGLKNLAGAFHEPIAVFAPFEPLLCLPEVEFRQGLVEAVKTGLACTPRILDLLEAEAEGILARAPGPLAQLTAACAEAKVATVAADPREAGNRERLNLGHTVGHALEAIDGLGPSHGDAVAFGLAVAMILAVRTRAAPRTALDRLLGLYRKLGLTLNPGREAFQRLDRSEFARRLAADKKNRAGRVRMVLPRGPGAVDLGCQVDLSEILGACEEVSQITSG